jgi:signal transduction histidine kinase
MDAQATKRGLPYARCLVHVLGGTITVDNAVGEGSTFTVGLPVQPSEVDAGWANS